MTEASFDSSTRNQVKALALLLTLTLTGAVNAQDENKAPQKNPVAPPTVEAPPPKHKAVYAHEYYHSFKEDREIAQEFHWHGLDPQGCVEFEAAGMRITLPAGHPGKRMGTGVGVNTTVKGDF